VALGQGTQGLARDEALAQAAALRQACFHVARQRLAIAGRALGEGSSLLLYCPQAGAKGQAWLLAQAEDLGRSLSRSMGLPICVGVSRPQSEDTLPEAFRQAEWALLMGLQRDRRVQAYEEAQGGRDAALDSFEAGQALQKAVLDGQSAQVAAAREALLGSATRTFPGREDLQRPQLLMAVLQLFESLHQRGLVEGPALEAQRAEALRSLREAESPPALAQALGHSIDQLSQLARSPRSGASRLRVDGLRRRLKEDAPTRDLLWSARQAGVSPSRFSRLYKEGGEAFGQARRQRRLEQAAELLRQGSLPVWRVAQECGYRSSAHFCQLFKGFYGSTPAAYRRKSSNKR
jgi:AraC-like DNA-binding protein